MSSLWSIERMSNTSAPTSFLTMRTPLSVGKGSKLRLTTDHAMAILPCTQAILFILLVEGMVPENRSCDSPLDQWVEMPLSP